MNQVDLDNWEKMYDSFYICEFPFSVGEFEEKYSINFEVFYAVISINNSLYMFRGFSDKTQKKYAFAHTYLVIQGIQNTC